MKRFTALFLVCFFLVGFFWNKTIDFTNKTPEQLGEDIKELDNRIQQATILPTSTGEVVAVINYLAEPSISAILSESTRIKDILKVIATGKGTNPLIGVNIMLYEPSVDKFGNKGQALALTLGWHVQTLNHVTWDRIENWQVIDLSGILERGPFANNAITSYCKDGATSYGEVFCKNAGY